MFKNKIIKDTILLTIMQLALDSASLLLNVFITRQLGASAIGIFSLMGSFLGLAGIISNGNAFLCTSRLISEELGKSGGNPNRILLHGIKLCVMLSMMVSILIFLFSGAIGNKFFSGAAVIGAVRLMPIALISGAIAACLKGYFNACRKASEAAFGDILEFAVKSGAIVILTLLTTSHNEAAVCRIMIISIIIGNLSSLIYMLILFSKKRMRCCQKGTLSFRDYVGFAFPIMGGGILTSVLSSANDALVPVCLRQYGDSPEQALAMFGIFEAIVIPTLFFPSVALCSLSGMIVTESARASAAGNYERIRSIASRLIECTMIYSVFSAAVIMRFGMPIGEMLGGGETAGRMITVIAPVIPFIYMEIVLEAMIKGLGLQAFSSLNYLAEYVIRISTLLIIVPHFGFAGIAVSYYSSNIFGNTSRLIKLIKSAEVGFKPVKWIVSPIFYALLTMFTAELLCRLTIGEGESLWHIVGFTAVWLVLYGGTFGLMAYFNTKESKSKAAICT